MVIYRLLDQSCASVLYSNVALLFHHTSVLRWFGRFESDGETSSTEGFDIRLSDCADACWANHRISIIKHTDLIVFIVIFLIIRFFL